MELYSIKDLKELGEYMKKNKDSIVIIGSKVGAKDISEESLKKMSENYNNKTFRRDNKKFWDSYYDTFDKLDRYDGTIHTMITKLIDLGYVKKVYSQGVDGIMYFDPIIYPKGAYDKFICSRTKCSTRYTKEEVDKNEDKKCPKCGGLIRPTLLFSGENYDKEMDEQLLKDIEESHTIITIGLDVEDEFFVYPLRSYDEIRDQEYTFYEGATDDMLKDEDRNKINKTIVAIHNEDEDFDYNEIFKCNFQALGELEESVKRFIKGIVI